MVDKLNKNELIKSIIYRYLYLVKLLTVKWSINYITFVVLTLSSFVKILGNCVIINYLFHNLIVDSERSDKFIFNFVLVVKIFFSNFFIHNVYDFFSITRIKI